MGATWRDIARAARLRERRVIVLAVESHCEWQDLYDGLTSDFAFFGNVVADVLAGRAAETSALPRAEAQRFLALKKRANLVQERIAVAARPEAAAAPAPPVRVQSEQLTPVKRNLGKRLRDLGHQLYPMGKHRWGCSA